MSYAVAGSQYSFSAFAFRSDGGWEDVTSGATWASLDTQIAYPWSSTPGLFSINSSAAGQAGISATYQSHLAVLLIPVIRTGGFIYPRLSVSGGDPRTIGTTAPVSLSLQLDTTSSQPVTNLAQWTSANPSVAVVEGGSVRAVGPGTTMITATYSGLTVDYGLSVLPRK